MCAMLGFILIPIPFIKRSKELAFPCGEARLTGCENGSFMNEEIESPSPGQDSERGCYTFKSKSYVIGIRCPAAVRLHCSKLGVRSGQIFFKMVDEDVKPPYKRDSGIPTGYGWSDMNTLKGAELESI